MTAATFTPTPPRPAPKTEVGVIGWLHHNLFSNWWNTLLTFVALYIVYLTVAALYQWGFADAVWVAKDRRECFDINKELDQDFGACWAGVIVWMDNFIYGRYPRDALWRIHLGGLLLVVWMAPIWFPRVKGKILIGFSTVFLYPFLAGYLFMGGDKGWFLQLMVAIAIVCIIANTIHVALNLTTGRSLPDTLISLLRLDSASEKAQRNALIGVGLAAVAIAYLAQSGWQLTEIGWTKWGGLFLTLVISGIGIATALPGGIILALGRRSQMPIIRVLCISFIEVFRSVPLITVLFMATTMFPLFLPEGFTLNKLVQVIVAVCLFNACYMAENVRAGLQAIPKGQYEAASAMGLGYWRMMGLVVMPQALKYMIPNIVGNFIGLLKDTVLVSIIGLFDFLRMLQAVSQDVPWRGLHKEPLIFGALVFFVLCFAMSKYSRHLEATLGAGDRR